MYELEEIGGSSLPNRIAVDDCHSVHAAVTTVREPVRVEK
jgi:hypothetical protein